MKTRGRQARNKLLKGVNEVGDTAKIMIGPKGGNMIYLRHGKAITTNDGGVAAEQVMHDIKDPIVLLGAKTSAQSAAETNRKSGDARKTTLILNAAVAKRCFAYRDSMETRERLDREVGLVRSHLVGMATQISSEEEIEHIATVSAESPELGAIVASAIVGVGKDGAVTVQESPDSSVTVEIVNGMQIEEGYVSHYMANTDKGEAIFENAYILVTTAKISSVSEIEAITDQLSLAGNPKLVIISDGLDATVLGTLIASKMKGTFEAVSMKLPYVNKEETAQDIATVTGATVVSPASGITFKTVTIEHLGKADKVIVKKDTTVIVGGKGDVGPKIEELKRNRGESRDEALDKRIARLNGGLAVIKVGASTETEMKYKKQKIEDAVHAAKGALEEGIVEGGGMALYRIAHMFSKDSILRKPLQEPLKQIIRNAGRNPFWVLRNMPEGLGYDAKTNQYEDMVMAGIIDSVKSVRNAVENACSCAGILITNEIASNNETNTK